MDLEMTSLRDVLIDRITEIAVVLTDKDLNIVAEGPEIIIHVDPTIPGYVSTDPHVANAWDELRTLVAESTTTAEEAEERILVFLKQHVVEESAPLCGNTIHTDRHFLKIQMRSISDYLFYRCIDVSSIKELARRWAPEIYEEAERRKGIKPHRAKADIINSIEELKFYRNNFFKM